MSFATRHEQMVPIFSCPSPVGEHEAIRLAAYRNTSIASSITTRLLNTQRAASRVAIP